MASSNLTIAAGGTGGHFYPALAVAEALRKRGHAVSFLVAGRHAGVQQRMAEDAGFRAAPIPAPPIRMHPLHAPLTLMRLGRAVWAARRMLSEQRPDAVLAMGSYACVPTGLAAAWRGLPLVLHEGNSIVGRANRLLSRRARVLAFSLPLEPGQRLRCRTVQTGFPLRPQIIEAARARDAAASRWRSREKIAESAPVLLVFGGSQGADFLNRVVPAATGAIPAGKRDFQVVHLAGRDYDLDKVRAAYAEAGVRAHVKAYEEDMGGAYAASRFVISRAGAATVTELALFGLPAVLVPFPAATDDHQTANARRLAEAGLGEVVPQAAAGPERLANALLKLQQAPQERTAGVRDGIRLAFPDAAERVADLVEKCAAGEPIAGS